MTMIMTIMIMMMTMMIDVDDIRLPLRAGLRQHNVRRKMVMCKIGG